MKKVLVLGAGLVAKPLVDYLLSQPDLEVKVASRTVSKAEKLVGNHPRGKALPLNVEDVNALKKLVAETDLAISMVPYAHHVTVANLCIEFGKHMVTTSYVSPAMAELDGKAKQAGILILNEIGLDPGIDHMSAMKIIHNAQNQGRKITSYCGGLPAPEANTNPFGYKFSWSPRGVVLAAKNTGRYFKDKKEVFIPGEKLFEHYWTLNIEGLGELEAYTNRDCLGYIKIYGLGDIDTIFRGTLRNLGWCDTWVSIGKLGLLDEKKRDDLGGLTFAGLLRKLIDSKPEGNLKEDLASFLKLDQSSGVIKRLEWLGLLSEEPLPTDMGSALDVLAARLLEKLKYEENERDMIVLHHDFIAQDKEGKKEKITSTLIDFGIPGGDSSMSRTVGLPAAISANLILKNKINMTGVHIPVSPEIYNPVLGELEKLGIVCKEKSQGIK